MVAGAVSTPARAGTEQILQWLDEVMDPELPMVSVVGLGIVRELVWSYDCGAAPQLQVIVTPTYSGCPATAVIAASIRSSLLAHGVAPVEVTTRLSPAWTTDWMSEAARQALRACGIAPPVQRAWCAGRGQAVDIQALLDPARHATVPCPRCGSQRTRLLSQFGSTACKALYRCGNCLEPFDYFKPH